VTHDYHEIVERRLAQAGRVIMMLPMPRHGKPAEPGGVWPDVVQSYWDVMGSNPDEDETTTIEERQRDLVRHLENTARLTATAVDIKMLDEVLGWLWFIKVGRWRKVVVARMMVRPQTGKHVNSWRQIGRALGTNKDNVMRWHSKGTQAIVDGVARSGTK